MEEIKIPEGTKSMACNVEENKMESGTWSRILLYK